MREVKCPACGKDILDLEEVIHSKTVGCNIIRNKLFYDMVLEEGQRLKNQEIKDNYRLCKALAACYELQDYLANRMTELGAED